MNKKLIFLLLAIAFILVASSCTKKDSPDPGYQKITTGLVHNDVTYTFDGITKITFAVPDGSVSTTTIGSYTGSSQYMSTGIIASVGSNGILIVQSGWKYIQFRSANCSQTNILSIE